MNLTKYNIAGIDSKYSSGVKGLNRLTKIFERKHQWFIIIYTVFYLLGFKLLEMKVNNRYYIIHMELDDWIPFCEYFIIPYVLWFFYIAAAVAYFALANKNLKEYWQLIISLGIGMTLFLVISWIYPNGQELRPVVFERDNIFTDMVKMLYQMDTPTNIFPSIHVFNSVAVGIAIWKCEALQKHWLLRRSAIVLSILIVLSTMFLKQHSVWDVVCALALNAVVYIFVYIPGEQWAEFFGQRRRSKRLQKGLQDTI